MKKKVISVLIAVGILTSTICGCGSGKEVSGADAGQEKTATDAEQGTDKGTDAEQETEIVTSTEQGTASVIDPNQEYTITLWDINSAETDSKYKTREKALEEMAQLYPNVKVETSYFQDLQYREKLPVAAAANELPDIFFNWMGSTTISLINAGQVLNLTPYADELTGMWEESVASSCFIDGELYYMPSVIQAYLLYCNKDLLEENGLSVPATYDDLMEIIDVLRAKDINAMVAGGKELYPIAILQEIIDLRLSGSESILAQINGEASFDNEETVKSARMLADLVSAGGFPVNTLSMDGTEAFAQFTLGKAAMMYGGNWNSGMLDAEDLAFEVSAVNFPSVEGEVDPNAMLGGACDIYMISAATENPEVTLEWTKEFMKRFMRYQVEEAGCISGWKIKDIDNSNIGPIAQQQNEVFAHAGDMLRNWDIITDYEVATNLYNKICEVFSGQSAPENFGSDFESIMRSK